MHSTVSPRILSSAQGSLADVQVFVGFWQASWHKKVFPKERKFQNKTTALPQERSGQIHESSEIESFDRSARGILPVQWKKRN